jgi:transposase
MTYYAGLDVSLRSTHLCVIDEQGELLTEGKTDSEVGDIVAYLDELDVEISEVGLEAGTLTQYLTYGLQSAGFDVVCMEARQVKAALSAMCNKTDKNDARGIAQLLRSGWYSRVHVKSIESHQVRALLSSRKAILAKTFRELDNRTRHMAHDDPVCQRLMTAPGVGFVTALTFKSGVDDPARFKQSRTVAAHFGLTPRRFQSGEIDFDGHISRAGDAGVRSTLYVAANAMMTRSSQWSPLKAWGMKLAKTRGHKRAVIAVARKLPVILHRMWIDDTQFRWSAEAARS